MKILSIAKSFMLLALISCHVQIWASCSISTEPIHGIDSIKPYALVAGGSKGIGFAIAEVLASRNYNLILIARHEGPLVQAKSKLESLYGIHVEILMKDLSVESSASEIAAWCTERHIRLKMLCNVAGMGGVEDYLSIPLDTVQYMVRLNVESCMALSLTLLPLLEQNSPSYILNIASMAAFAPIPQKMCMQLPNQRFFFLAMHSDIN